ncbi:hypothetical protein RJ640_025595 [Escallonia rubra]|uniref:Pentatricopeptide repeat-containing protein n=1 Tax=Escallonia rubra TaxID=112253 RepID=A0AA88QJ89_9ASTE|nr:hypothetical protein RJ640_025595 [Escallonia rubra]
MIQNFPHNLRLCQLVHSKLTESETPLDSAVLRSLITLYSKCNDWVRAKAIFEGMDEKKDLVLWSAMISCFVHNGMESQSVATFAAMLRFGECPNEFCFTSVIQACCRLDYARPGLILFGFVMKTGYFESDLWVGYALIDLFAKGRGNLGSSKKGAGMWRLEEHTGADGKFNSINWNISPNQNLGQKRSKKHRSKGGTYRHYNR